MLSYVVQNHTLDPSSLFARVEYASVAHALLRTEARLSCACPSCLHASRRNPKLGLDRGGTNTQERRSRRPMCRRPCDAPSLRANGSSPRNPCRDQLLTASPPPPSPQAVKGFTAYVTCGSHSDCIAGDLPRSFCDDKRHCVSCTKWDPSDPSASIDNRRATACDGQHRSVGGRNSEHRHRPIAPQPRPMTLCAACRAADASQATAAGTCPSIAHASQGRALRLADVDCTERYAQLVRCAGRTWLFSRIEHFDEEESGLEPQPHTQLIARELLPSATAPGTRDASPPPTFAPVLLALDDDRPLKLSSNAAVTCTDDGDLLLYGGGEGGSGVAWLVGQPPPPSGSRTAAGGDGFRWSRPMVAWSSNKSQTRCVEARPHLPELCEYDGKLSILRHGGKVLAFTRSNLYAHGGRHVQMSSSLSSREGWSPFEQLSFEGYAAAPANNLYYAAVRSVPMSPSLCEDVLLGLFPGAINGRGGVYASVSADGVHWGELRRIFPSEIHASWRTADHPVEGALDSSAATQLSIVIEHHVSVPRRRRAASDPSEQPTDERAQAWCDAKLRPLYCEYTLPWAVTQHNTSHMAVRLGGMAPWLVSCPVRTHQSQRNRTNSECESTKHADERGEPASDTVAADDVPRAAELKRLKVAVLVSSGPLDMQKETLARKLTSSADFLLRPLRTVAEVSTFACLDHAQPSWQTELVRRLLAPEHTWHFTACSWQALSDVERRCCENERQPTCDAPELSTGEESASLHQFYRLAACFQHVLHSADGAAHDFYVRARPDLHWVGAFDTSALHGPEAPHRLGIRYRSAAGLHGLRLGQLQMAWYKVGPGACGEAHWQTDYPCFTLDDQFALVPARLAGGYFDFARRRLSGDFLTLRRQRAPLIANCSCWQCMEGRLTEYLLVHQVPLTILSLPATVVYDDHEAPPMLLPEDAGKGGGPDPTWSPSVRVDCALRNGTWGVAAWLVDAGLLGAATKAELMVEISTSYSMKALWQDTQAWQRLMELLWQKGDGPSTTRADFKRRARAALRRYAQRFLRHQRCNEPSAAAHAGCHEGGGEAALVSLRPTVSLPKYRHRQYRSRSARSPSNRTMAAHVGTATPAITFIVQYYRHPHQLGLICERLRSPLVEVIVHADSDSDADEAAFSSATEMCGALILRSRNVHEIRGYNLAARHARGELLAFSQDDRIPPPGGEWIRRVLAIYSLGAFAGLGALGLHRGGVQLWLKPTEEGPRPKMVGSCGDAADDVSGHKWDALLSERMSTPIRFVSFMNIGPIVMRRRAFEELGGFNMSYSLPGQAGIGFDHELVSRLWQVGWQAAVVCPSRATVFRNGCGGKSSAANLSARNAQLVRNRALYRQQFAKHAEGIDRLVAQAQRSLEGDEALLAQLRRTVRGCIDCEAGGEELRALKHRALGFADASYCRTADPRKITYEP